MRPGALFGHGRANARTPRKLNGAPAHASHAVTLARPARRWDASNLRGGTASMRFREKALNERVSASSSPSLVPLAVQTGAKARGFSPTAPEIGKPHPARRVLLPEDDVLLGPVQCPPGTDAPLQGAANTDADLGMATPDLVENGHRPQAWSAL